MWVSKSLTLPNDLKERGMGIIDIGSRRVSTRFVEDSTCEDQDSNRNEQIVRG
jgi:hypothetical protein